MRSAPRAFTFGRGYGLCLGVIAALGLPSTLVTPQVWKKAAGLLRADKEKSRARAIQLWPQADLGLVKHHGRAEALLIGRWYLEQKENGSNG